MLSVKARSDADRMIDSDLKKPTETADSPRVDPASMTTLESETARPTSKTRTQPPKPGHLPEAPR